MMPPSVGEMPSFLQSGDREDIVGRILEAEHPHQALLATDPAMPALERLLRYKRVATQLHPDRCADPRATDAFMKVSYAFDALSAMDIPLTRTEDVAARVASASSSSVWGQGRLHGQLPTSARWWTFGGPPEFDRMLNYRIELTKALCEGPAANATCRSLLLATRRACEHLDREKELPPGRFWPSRSKSAALTEASLSTVLVVDTICYLRTVHRFCGFLKRGFNHIAELEAASPASAIQDFLREALSDQPDSVSTTGHHRGASDLGSLTATLAPASASASPSASPSASGVLAEEVEEDPLDAFMKQLESDAEARGSKRAALEETTGSSCKRPRVSASLGTDQAAPASVSALPSASGKTAAASTKATLPAGPTATEEILKAAAAREQQVETTTPATLASQSQGAVAPLRRGPCAPQATGPASGSSSIRLATGVVIDLPRAGSTSSAGAASTDETSLTAPSAGASAATATAGAADKGAGNNKERSLQNTLLGELDSEDESELEDEKPASAPPALSA